MTRERRLWRPDVRQDVDDEIAFHLEQRQSEYSGRGMNDTAAREEARRRFGNIEAVAASCRRIDEQWYREQRRASMWNDLRQDSWYAVRALLRTPGFTATAVLTLALGIGANTAIFSVISGVLLRHLPYREPDRLVFVWSTSQSFPREPLTPGRLIDFREQLTSASGFAGISHVPFNLTGSGNPDRISGSSVSSPFFDVLGVAPLLGDTFHSGAADDRAVVLSHKLWTTRFGSDRSIVGRPIMLNGTARTVVAVMPADFDWPAITATPGNFDGPELWVPGTSRDIPRTPIDNGQDLAANRRSGYLRAVARLKDNVTVEQARREAELIAERLARQYPNDDGARSATVVPLREQFVGHVRRPMLVLLGAVAVVLAIACANIASLLLARSATRRREIAVRVALGASRSRIVRQFLTEATVLAFAGAAVGLLLAGWAQHWLTQLSTAALPGAEHASLDARVLLFTLALSVGTGILCGLVPARQVSTTEINGDLGEGGSRASAGPRAGRTRDVLVASEIAVALVLLVAAGLLLRSFYALSHVDTGIETRNLLTFDLFLSGERAQFQRRQVAFYDDVLRAIGALPGVRSAGAAVTLPIGGDDFAAGFAVEGRPLPPPGQEPRAGYQVVTPGYFAAMGIPIVAGRDFRAGDTPEAAPVVMVNQTFARQQWPGEDPIGRRMRIGRGSGGWMTVVGVAGDIRHLGPATPPRPEFYQPHSQSSFPFMAFVLRTEGAPEALVPSIRSAVMSLDAAQPISGVNTMEQHLSKALSRPRLLSTLVAGFGALALLLALVGIYGVMAYAVAQRTREIAIRTALGASAREVMRTVLARAAWVAVAGVAGGLVLTLGASRALAGMLFEVTPTDAPTYAAVVVLLAAVALLAAAIPAVRATRIEGARVLRY
jgi:putative ABC transport system permease protein